MKVSIEQLEKCTDRYKEWHSPDNVREGFLEESTPTGTSPPDHLPKGNILGTKENLKKRKELLEAIRTEPAKFAYERAIGENDSVYSNFIELIVEAKRKVGRIVVKDGVLNLSYATGFMDLLEDIDLEELGLQDNVEFKEYQCSLEQLQAETSIDFSPLFEFDTFIAPTEEPLEITSEAMLMELMANV